MPQTKEITITIKISADTPFRLKDKEKLLQTLANLSADNTDRMLKLGSSPKALKGLEQYWGMLESQYL